MNNINLYEKMPITVSPIKILEFSTLPRDFVLHWHEHTEILFIKSGTLKLRCTESLIKAGVGDCIVINGNELHEGIGGNCEFVCIHLSPSLFEENHYLFEKVIKDETVASIIIRLAEENKNTSHSSALATKGLTLLLLSHLIKNHAEQVLSETKYQQYTKNSQIINDAIKYIEQNYTESIGTASLAKLSYLSEGHFCHVFKDVTGKTVTDYINSLRIEKAADLLKNTTLSITDISMQCGFSDSNYFARVFKKYKKLPPSSLRT